MIVKNYQEGEEVKKDEMKENISSSPICWNIILPFYMVIMGFQWIFFFIPIVLVEWACAHILSNRIFHMDITKRYTLLVTFLSNLFSTLLGVMVILAINFSDHFRVDVLFNEFIPSLILLYAFSILLEFFIVYFMFKRYLKKKADDDELKREHISRQRLIGISGVIVFAQNTVTYLFFWILIMVISSPELI